MNNMKSDILRKFKIVVYSAIRDQDYVKALFSLEKTI